MEYRVLGSLEVVEDGETVDVGPRKQRSLLALLLINANRVVSTDRILEDLWGDDAEGKENALWVYVSRLRSALEPDRAGREPNGVLVTKDHGYQLTVPADAIDSHRFEEAVAEARAMVRADPSGAGRALQEALELWRGSAYEDFEYDEFARAEIERLDELRLVALEDRIEADLRSGKARELIPELESLRKQYPLRERPVGQLMLALYRAGRQADALRAFERFRQTVGEELGIEPSPELARLEEQILLHDSRLRPRAVAGASDEPALVNPFKGLRAFHEADADVFFGRDRLVADVVRRLGEGERLMTLVGPSGSGKSSVVRAGLVPALRKGALDGSEGWLIAQMVPGAHPFAELEAALLRAAFDAPESLSEQLQDDETGLLRAALRVLPDESSRLFLIIDQFEELFTLVDDEGLRRRFMDNLVTALDDPHGRVIVVTTLRADFYDRPLAYPELGSRLGDGVVNVVPMTSAELEAAAQAPAGQRGVTLEPALLATLLADVVGEPGALPLFQYTLSELFERRVDDLLTAATYQKMGGVQGALSRRADELYQQLDPEAQDAARQIFLRLVTIAETSEWSRRRVHAAEIVSLGVDIVATQEVLDLFGSHRLLTFDRDHVSGAPTLEVAHEALLSEWERLREWIEGSREDVRRHQILGAAATEWMMSGRQADYLYSGSRLDDYAAWSATATMALTAPEREFLDASLAQRSEAKEAEQARLAQEQKLERRARARLWGMVAAVVVLVGVGVGLLVWLLQPEGERVALITQTDEDEVFANGLARADRDFDVSTEYLTGPFADIEDDYRNLAEAGTALVMTGFIEDRELFSELAEEYPNTHFAIIDSDEPLGGVTTVDFAVHEGSFLAGAAAALTSRTGIIGFVSVLPYMELEAWRGGFEAGAREVNPDVEIISVYTANPGDVVPWADAATVRTETAGLFRRGADVVLAAAGRASVGAYEAAREDTAISGTHRWVIGPDEDVYRDQPDDLRPHILASVIKKYGAGIYEVIAAMTRDDLHDDHTVLGMADDAIDLLDTGGLLDPSVAATVAGLRNEVVSGARTVPLQPTETIAASWVAEEARRGEAPFERAALSFDGESCTYVGPTSFPAGVVLQIDIHNHGSIPFLVGVGKQSMAGWVGFPQAAVTPLLANGATWPLYLQLTPGAPYEVYCGIGDNELSLDWIDIANVEAQSTVLTVE